MRRMFLLVPAFLLALVSLPDPALADDVHCGQVLTRDTVLRRDLVDCPGDGLVIGADEITLDLGGHTISGRGADGSVGIKNAGHDGDTIRNGAINRFGRGVLLTGGANRNRL